MRLHTLTRRRQMRVVAAAALAAFCALSGAPASALPAFPDVAKQYWFGNLRIKQVWGLGATGQGMTVAVLDSGVQADQVELRGAVLDGTDFAGGTGRTDTDSPRGHGTSMARRIAGQGGGKLGLTGIAPEAKILPVNIDNKQGAATMAQGIKYAVDHKAKVINISEGLTGSCPTELAAAVRDALGKGAVVVASAGNSGDGSNQPEYPGSCPGVLAVGAVDGSLRAWEKTQRQSYVDVASAGVKMYDQNLAGDEGTSTGTSDATALVSGSVALVWSKLRTLTNRQVVARLLATTVDDTTTKGKDDATGYGAVRPYFAITSKVPADAPNPVFDEVKGNGTGGGSASASGTASSGSGPASAADGSGTSPAAQKSDSDSGSGVLVGTGIGVAVLVVLGLAVLLVVRSRRRPAGHPAGPWTGAPPSNPPPPGPPGPPSGGRP